MSQIARPNIDQALKRTLLRAHDGFLAQIAPGLTWRGERSPELPTVGRQADLLWEVERGDGRRGLVDIELQIKPDADIPERMAEYAIRVWRRDHLPVRSIVIFLRRARNVPRSPFVLDWMGQEVLRVDFVVIKLWEIPAAQVLDTLYVDLWPLAGLMANMTVARVVTTAERIAATPAPRHERSSLTGLLAMLAGVQLSRAAIHDALRRNPMIDDLLRESSVADLFIDETMRKAVGIALHGRFGSLDDPMRAVIEQADEAALEDVLAHVTSYSLEQIRERLSQHAPPRGRRARRK